MGVNNLNILGNLGRDPEKVGTFNKSIVRFSVGVSEAIKGEKKTTWFNCVSFAAKADYILKTCQKGSQVFIEGPFRSEEYEGKTRWTLFVNKIIVLNNRKESSHDKN